MATLLMHLFVGRELIRRGGLEGRIGDRSSFYLGCIAPDSVNLEGFAPKEKRWGAHLRDGNLQTWYENIEKFYYREHGRGDEALLLGYAVHNLTDVAWDECFHDRIWGEMERRNLPPMMDMGLGWDDCFRFDYEELRKSWWIEEVAPALRLATPQDIGTISKEVLDAYRNHTLERYPSTIPSGCPILVCEQMVQELSLVVEERCHQYLT